MDTKVKESAKTRPLFDKAVAEISQMLDRGEITDKEYASTVMQVFTGHIKVMNAERAQDMLKFAVNRSLSSNPEEFKTLVRNSLPEYAGK